MFAKIGQMTITALPLSLLAAALWGVSWAYDAELIMELGTAQITAVALLIGAHLFAPLWAAVRPKWWRALLVQMPVFVAAYLGFLAAFLAPPHGFENHWYPGVGGLVIAIFLLVGFLVYVPQACGVALLGQRWLEGDDGVEDT